MAKFTSGTRFKCNQSGNVFEFFTEHDIKTMRTHPEYTELVQTSVEVKEESKVNVSVVNKKTGRPSKLNTEC